MPRRAANETLSLQFGLSLIHLQVDEATGVTDVYGCERYVITIGLKYTFFNLKFCFPLNAVEASSGLCIWHNFRHISPSQTNR